MGAILEVLIYDIFKTPPSMRLPREGLLSRSGQKRNKVLATWSGLRSKFALGTGQILGWTHAGAESV